MNYKPAASSGSRAWLLAALTALAVGAVAVLPGSAAAVVTVLDQEGNQLTTIEKGKCSLAKRAGSKAFKANATSTDGAWRLHVEVKPFAGFGAEYPLEFGATQPYFFLYGPGASYSNVYEFPGGMAPGAGGAIKFSANGKRMGIGFYAAGNYDYSQAVAFAGGIKCKFSRRR